MNTFTPKSFMKTKESSIRFWLPLLWSGIGFWTAGCADTHLYLRGGVLDRPQGESPRETPVVAPKASTKSEGPPFVKSEESLDNVRLRFTECILARDRVGIQNLLTPDFVWREDETPLQETPFEFWDRHKLWGELQRLLGVPVVKLERLAISPKGSDRAGFRGSRLAWRQVGGEWRLAYFYAANEAQ